MPAYTLIYSDAVNNTLTDSHTGAALSHVNPSITITNGKRKTVAIPLPCRGKIVAVGAVQTSGTSKNITVDVLNSALPFGAGEVAIATAAGSPFSMHQVIPTISITSGTASFSAIAFGYPYNNVDTNMASIRDNYLYLTIAPTSSVDDIKLDFRITIDADII